MKRFVMVLTDKGGTGKTLFSRVVADRLLRDGVDTLLVDGDGEIGGLYQFYKSEGVKTVRFTGSEKDRDLMMGMIDHDKDVVLVDMPAASLKALKKFDEDVGFFAELKRAGYKPTLINVLSPFKSATRTVKEMTELAGSDADYAVVINHGLGDEDDYFLWYGDAEHPASSGRNAMAEHGGIEIVLPKLQTGVLVAIDFENMQFRASVGENSRLSRVHRSRLVRWMDESDSQLNKIGHFLGLG